VLVNVPMDMLSRELEASDYPLPLATGSPALPGGAAERIVGELAAASQPLVYIGGGLRSSEARAGLLRLIERLELPVAHSLMGKGAIPDSHPLLVGMLGFWGTEFGNAYAREADVILALGTRFAETDANSWDPRFGLLVPPTRLLQIDIDAAEIGRNYPVEFGAVAGLEEALPQLWDAAERTGATPAERPSQRAAIAAARSEIWARMAERGARDDFPLAPERILEDLRRHLPADTVLVTDVGWNKNGVAQCYRLPESGRFVTPGGFSTMGYGPAAAIGAKIASPDRPIVALIGDGAMSNQLSAIVTAVEHRVGVVWIVMNNAAFGTIAGLQESHYGTDYGCVFLDAATGEPYTPDFAGIARSCGAHGIRVGAADDLVPALEEALAGGGPALIDVPMVNDPVPTPGHWNINDIYQGAF
jgi:acetolactate synthase-1/2/3 large subunit